MKTKQEAGSKGNCLWSLKKGSGWRCLVCLVPSPSPNQTELQYKHPLVFNHVGHHRMLCTTGLILGLAIARAHQIWGYGWDLVYYESQFQEMNVIVEGLSFCQVVASTLLLTLCLTHKYQHWKVPSLLGSRLLCYVECSCKIRNEQLPHCVEVVAAWFRLLCSSNSDFQQYLKSKGTAKYMPF